MLPNTLLTHLLFILFHVLVIFLFWTAVTMIFLIIPLVLNDIHTCRKLVVREGTRIDVSVK